MSTSPSYKSGPILQRVADFITNLKFPGVPFSIRTPTVTDEAVLEEKKRRGQLGLDPDFYTTPQEDLGLTQPTPEFKADRQRRIEKVTGKSTLPVVKPPMPEVTDDIRKLAFEPSAPGEKPQDLRDYYAAQKAVGAAEKEGISSAFSGDMKKWAEANPDLALRLIQKRAAKGMATVGGQEVPLEEEATVEMDPMERIKFIQGGFR